MKRFPIAVACTFFALLVMSPTMQAQVKIGVVDFETIFRQLPEAKTIENRLRGLRQSIEDTLRNGQAALQARFETYQKQQALMSAEARQKEEAELVQLREQLVAYQQDRLGQQGALAQVQDSLLAPVRERVRSAIERVAKEEKLGAVMDKSIVAYFDPKLDITFKVLDYLNRGPH